MSESDCIDIDALDSGPLVESFCRDSILSLPPEAHKLLPPPSLSVSAFLSNSGSAPVARQSAMPQRIHFSHDLCDPNPHAIIKALKARSTFLPLLVVRSLEIKLDQALRDGSCSIIDTYYEKYPLPFWVITLWRKLLEADVLCAEWVIVEERIRSSKHQDPDLHLLVCGLCNRLGSLLHRIPWNAPILGFPVLGWRPGSSSLTAESLAEGSAKSLTPIFIQFFRNGFLDNHAMNMMLYFLDIQVQRHESYATQTVVADLTFTNRLLAEYSGDISKRAAPSLLLARYKALFMELGREVLYFAVNSGQDHWVAFKVNFPARTIAYGDSLAGTRSKPKVTFSALTAWLKHILGPSSGNFDSDGCQSTSRHALELTPVLPSSLLAAGSEDDLEPSGIDVKGELQPTEMLPSPVSYTDSSGPPNLTDSDEKPETSTMSHVISPTRAPGKHQRSSSDDIAALAISTSGKRQALSSVSEEQHYGPTGLSRAARKDRAANEAYLGGSLTVPSGERAAFLRRAQAIHPDARLDPNDLGCKKVWHPVCEKWITMDAPKRTGKYRLHHERCAPNRGLRKNRKWTKAAEGSLRIDTMFEGIALLSPGAQSVTSRSTPATGSLPVPSPSPAPLDLCCGLRPVHDERLSNLLGRGPLGGWQSIQTIAKEQYKQEYKHLSDNQKLYVRTASTATACWQVHYEPQPHIRSTSCLRECDPSETEGIDTGPTDLCQPCADLLYMREFKNALARPAAPLENLKFVLKTHCNKQQAVLYGRYVGLEAIIEQADSKCSPLMCLVTKVLKGELKNADVFLGLMEVMAAKEDRLSRGKGMQGITRSPALVSFCHATLISSPRAYRLLGKHLPVPSERNLWLNYTGPVSISCDDTQLLSKFSPYYDSEKEKWYLLGGVGEPIEIDEDVEGVQQRIASTVENSEAATKCCLWCLQVPTPGVPVFILAAMPISSTLKADDLLTTHNRLLNGLLNAGVCVVSYACDGSKTERKVASQFLMSANDSETTLIPHPRPGFPDIPIILYRFGPRSTPIVTIQDVKHAMKTARNSLYSGTRSMILGNCVVHYLQVLMLSVDPRSPLYQRDVSKVDHQDDCAATRLFSSAFLQHIARIASEHSTGVTFTPTPLAIVSNDLPPPPVVLKHSLKGLMAW
ncbi:hypothetical protein FRC06_001671, partial [Ceratobasidium sp. 370]